MLGYMKIQDPKAMGKAIFVYSFQNEKEYLFFGAGPMSEILNFRQVIGNSNFSLNKEVTVVFHSVHTDKYEALSKIPTLVKTLNAGRLPIVNKEGGMLRGKKVRCLNDGTIYRNAREACLLLNINPSRMSQHLRRRPGFRSLENGYQFELIEKDTLCDTSSS